MTPIHPQEGDLLKYADGRLSDKEALRIEKLIKTDPEAASIVQDFEHSNLPFREAFEPLIENVDEKGELAKLVLQTPYRENKRYLQHAAIAASLVFGLLIGGLFISHQDEDHENWMVQVADYQLLYTRDTIRHTQLTANEVESLNERLNLALGTKITIPDLSSQQLTFKRGQILSVNGQPLIQLVYLPDHGDPVALCITVNKKPATNLLLDEARGMTFVHWANNGLEFILIGKAAGTELKSMAQNAASQMEHMDHS